MDRWFAPPGARVKLESALCGGLLGALLVEGCLFFFRFFRYRDKNLYWELTGIRMLIPEAKMPGFNDFAAGELRFFTVLFFTCVAIAAVHYLSFHMESKSIYVMRRIPNKAELHVRCLALPAIFLAIGIVLAVVLYCSFLYVYIHYTPEGHLPENMNPSFWRILL